MKNTAPILLAILITLGCVYFGRLNYQRNIKTSDNYQLLQLPISKLPISSEKSMEIFNSISAQSYYVIDVNSGAVLAEKAAHTLFFPASTTKLMTVLIAKEQYDQQLPVTILAKTTQLDDNFPIFPGMRFTVSDLIKASLIESVNTAALNLALADPNGQDHFIEQMNSKAEQLKMTNTRFDNPVGFDSEYMQSTARDLAILSKKVIEDEDLKEIVAKKTDYITELNKGNSIKLENTNKLLGFNDQVFGIKTGTTNAAGEVLITYVDVGHNPVILVVLNSADRYQDTKLLIEWLNNQVDWLELESLTGLNH